MYLCTREFNYNQWGIILDSNNLFSPDQLIRGDKLFVTPAEKFQLFVGGGTNENALQR